MIVLLKEGVKISQSYSLLPSLFPPRRSRVVQGQILLGCSRVSACARICEVLGLGHGTYVRLPWGGATWSLGKSARFILILFIENNHPLPLFRMNTCGTVWAYMQERVFHIRDGRGSRVILLYQPLMLHSFCKYPHFGCSVDYKRCAKVL